MEVVSEHVVVRTDGEHPYKVVLRKNGLPTEEYDVDSVREGEELIRGRYIKRAQIYACAPT